MFELDKHAFGVFAFSFAFKSHVFLEVLLFFLEALGELFLVAFALHVLLVLRLDELETLFPLFFDFEVELFFFFGTLVAEFL